MPLHPQAKTFLSALASQQRPSWDQIPYTEAREIFRDLDAAFGSGPTMDRVENLNCDGVPVRLFSPNAQEDLPCLMYFHGGGWVLGDLDTHDTLCRRIAAATNCAVVAVDYRRAPEEKYPAAFDDCYHATNFVSNHSDIFRIDPNRLMVAGDSAGGNLSAAVAIQARNQNGPKLRLQILIYPVIEPNFSSGSYLELADGHGLTRDVMKYFWEQYIDGSLSDCDEYAVPSKANLDGVAPAHVITAEYDVLRDEGERFAELLKEANVFVSTKRYAGMLHGFFHYAGLFDDALQAVSDIAAVIEDSLR